MRPIGPAEVLNLYDYELMRHARREAVIALKADRRTFAEAEVALVADHPGDRGRTVLTPAARRRLAEDLS